MNQRKTGIFLSYLNIVLHAVIGFLYVPILLHYIGKSEYGLYQLMGSLIAYFGVMDFGLSAAVIRFYAKYRAEGNTTGMENILAISMRCYGIVTALALLIGGVCYQFLDQIFARSMTLGELAEAKEIFLLLLLNIVITLSTILQAMNRYDSRARVYFCTGLLNLFLAIPLAIRFGGIGCAFATGLSMFLGNGVVMNWFYKKYIGLDIPGFWRQIGRITVPVLICLGMWAMSGLSEWGKCCLLERYWGTRYCMVL